MVRIFRAAGPATDDASLEAGEAGDEPGGRESSPLAHWGRHRVLTVAFGVLAVLGVLAGSLVVHSLLAPSKPAITKAVTVAPTPATPVASAPAVVTSGNSQSPMKPLTGFLGTANVWGQDISTAPLAPDSAALVGNVAGQVARGVGATAAFNVWSYNGSVYTVSPNTPTTTILWDNCQSKTYTPSQLFDPAFGGNFLNVPMPDDVIPPAGTDGAVTLYDPSLDKLWEFWKLRHDSAGWHACWGGRIDNWSTSPGFFTGGMGVSASGLSVAAGLIGIKETQAGQINHAIGLSLMDIRNWTQFSYPAQRSDGGQPVGTVAAVAEGQRFRLDPSINVNALPLTPIGKMIATAAQKYGFIVTDKSGKVGVGTESGAGAALTAPGNVNPWTTLMGTTASYSIMKNFPWGSLQAISYNYAG